MKIKNTKYILVLLAGIISLASGCGCSKDGRGKGSTGADPVLEAIEKKLLDELKPLFLECKKIAPTAGGIYDEAKETKEFEKAFTDLDVDSYTTEWIVAKSSPDQAATLLLQTLDTIWVTKSNLASPLLAPSFKSYLNKVLEFLENRKKK